MSDAPSGESSVQPPPLPQPRARWRWAVHLALLTAYVLGLGIAGAMLRSEATKETTQPAMPSDLRSLAILCIGEIAGFALVFGAAWLFSRARRDELFLRWRGNLQPIVWGIVYSVLLRLVIMLIMIPFFVTVYFAKGEKAVEQMRPKTEATVNMQAMKDPMYALFAVTVISFGMAGFREELWRAGMLAGLAGVAPMLFANKRGQYLAVFLAAIVFGLGHLPQGWGGVGIITCLGFGLGWIMVRHQSAWEAIIAHGFFDATTFAALYFVVKYFPESLKGLAIFG